MSGQRWDGTEGHADWLLDREMEGAGSVADAARAMDSWVMRVAIAREKQKQRHEMILRGLEVLEHAQVHIAKIFLDSRKSGQDCLEFREAGRILDTCSIALDPQHNNFPRAVIPWPRRIGSRPAREN